MADPKRQAAFEELMRRGVIKTPEQREAVVELARRGLLRTTPYASFESTKTPAAAATKPGQTAKPKAAAKPLDTYRGTGASMRAAPPPEMSFLDRAVAVLNIPRAALLAMPNALDALRRSQEGRELLARDPEGRKVEANLLKMSYPERVKYFAEGGTADPAQARARQEATATLGKLGRAGSVAMEFGAQAATDPLTWVTGGGSAVAKSVPQVVGKIVKDSAKAGRIARPLTRAAQAANVGAAGALTAQQLATGVPQVIEGVKRGSVEQTTAGVLATAFGTLAAIGTVHGLRQWQADTGVKLTPQQEQVILKAPPKNRPNIAKRFAKIQEARAKDVPTRMPPVTPTPVEAAPVPAKTTKARKPKAQKAAPTEKPDHELTPEQFTSKHINSVNGASVIQQLGLDGARKFYADQHRMIVEDARQRGLKTSEPLPAVGDNQPLGNEAAAPQPAPVGSAGRGDVALPAESVPTPQAEAVPPVQRGLEAGAEAAPEAALAAPPENGLHTIRLPDFLAEAGEKGLDLTDAMRLHKAAVQQALDAGLPVDKAVLKPYPGMKKGGTANAVPQQETAGGLLRQAEAGAGAGVGLPRVGGQDRPIETAGEGQAQAAQVAPQVEPTISEAIQHFESIPKDRSTAPDSLPLYGANGEEVARKYFLPADYYEERNGLQVIASKYRTPEYNAALQAWEKLHSSANTREPRFLRPAETRLRTEQRKIEDAARKTLLPQALPPVETPPLQTPTERLPEGPTVKLPNSPETPTAKLPETRKITDEMRAFADEMEAEAKKRLGSGLSARIDAGLFDYAIIGAMKLLRKSMDFADWSAEMVAEHGEKIKPHLQDIWEAAHEYYNNAVRRRFPELPELTLPKAAKPDAPQGNTEQPSLRHRDMQAIAAELGVGLDPKITESWQQVTDRALKEYDSILDSLKRYDPDTHEAPTREERIVAGARIREIQRELNPLLKKTGELTKEESGKITALEMEAGQLLNMAYRAGSEAGRNLNLQKLLLPDDPTDPASVLLRAQRLAGGELSIPARRTLTRLAEEAKTATDAATARVTRRQKGEATAQEETPVKALSPSFGRQNKIFTKDKFEAAQARLKEKLNRASSGLDPTLLADLVEIGGFYFEGRIRQFGAWAARLRQDWPALTEADLQRVWIHVKADKSLAQGQRSVPKPQTFVEELARRVGNENARAIVDTIEEKQPGLLEKLIRGSRLSEAEQTLVGQTYLSHTRQRAGTAPLTHSQAMQSIQAAANAMRPKTPRKPSQRPVQAAKPTELTGNPEKDFRAALSRRMGAKMADSFMAELKQAGLLQRLLNGESLTGLQARQVDALNQKYTLERQKAGYQGKAMDAFRAALTDARAQARQEAAALRKAQAAHEKNRPAATTRTQSQRDFDRAQAANIRIMQRAKDTLSNLGRDAKKRGTNPLLDDATLAYAKGARDLHRFTAALRKKHEGTTFTEAELNKLFREAAEQYHKDFRQVEAIKRQMTEVVAKEVYRQKPWYGKIWHGAKELNNLSRSLILGPDISFLLRQGGPLVVNRFGHMNKKALPEMWRALQREEVAQAIDASIRHGANADIYEKAGLDFSDIEPGTKPGEDIIASDWLQKVPGVRRPYRAADRANTVLINKIRAESFDLLYDPQKHNLEQAKAIARYINVATGRGDLSNAAIAGLVRGTADVFLSPRYLVSRFQYLLGQPLWKAPKGARKLIAKEYANYYLRVGLFLGLASQIPGVEVEADPRSSDFATVRIGDVNIDILSGLKQPVTMSARVLPLGEWGHKNFLTEEKKAIPIDPFRTFLNFFLYKMSPLPQLGADVALRQGKDFKGDPLTVGGVSRRLFLNITAQDVVEALLEKGIDPKTALELTGSALASQVGVGANLRDRAEEARKRAQKAEARKEAAREKNQVDRIMQRLTDPIVPNVPGGVLTGAGTF